jgi:hypothetical protein
MSHSTTWQNARDRRAARRADDPKVQARARQHAAREEQDRQKQLRRQALVVDVDQALAQHILDGAA